MKQNWEVKKLGDVCDIVNGSTPLRSNKEFWDNGNFPWFTIDDIRVQGRIIRYTNQQVTQAALKKLRVLPIGAVLLCCTASIGEYAISEIKLTTNQQFNGLIIKDKKELLPLFLLYFSSTLKDTLLNLSGKTTIDFIPISRLKEIDIPFPPLPEQKRIVSILEETFAGITKAKENAEKNLSNAREVSESYLQSVFANPSNSWEKKKLKEVCTLFNGKAYNSEELLKSGKYSVLRVGNFFTNKNWYYSDLELPEDKYCDYGDLLYAWSASFGPKIWSGGKVIYHYHIWKVIPKIQLISKEFLFILLDWDKEKIKADQGTGTTMTHVSKGSMEERVIPLPPLKEQQSIVSKLDELSVQTKKLETIYKQKLANLEELKKSVLQKAFNGELPGASL